MSQQFSNLVKHKAYSNIALIKYWGKFGRQYPCNPSLSMLIPQCFTECQIEYESDTNGEVTDYIFNGESNSEIKEKTTYYLKSITDIFPFLDHYNFKITSSNNFPHAAGIASSASAYAALSKCLVEILQKQRQVKNKQQLMSSLARLGSGSAARSIGGGDFSIWGKTEIGIGSNDFAIDFDIAQEAKNKLGFPLLDSILVVDSKEKEVSSTEGHALMNTHLYKESRIAQANENFRVLYQALQNGDIKTFGEIVENEAWSLHALMMTSYPSYCLLQANTLNIIEKIKDYRGESDVPVYFTLDAGPNIHCLYPFKYREKVEAFLKQEILPLCENIIWGEVSES